MRITTAAPARAPTPPPAPPVELPNPTKDELAALAEDVEIEVDDRRRILALRRLVDKNDPHMMLGVSQGADAKQLKRAYFRLSKEIHPDTYYGKRVGSFGPYMAQVFETISKAYATLTGGGSGTGAHAAIQQAVQTPQEYAAEVFDRACQLEVSGDHLGAMKLFAAAVRTDPQTRYLRRAATCALAAGQPKTALEYAKKAQTQSPNDPSSARLLAAAFRAVGKFADAEDVLVMAMAMKSENDTLMVELRHDLADVRRMLASGEAR
jgi:tetratricopeptide (TPR) repeat protein